MQLKDTDAILAAMSDKYEELRKRNDNTLASDFVHIAFLIASAPTIDPVRHGRWIVHTEMLHEKVTWTGSRCSLCDAIVKKRLAMYNYCPCCGAMMEVVEDDS